MVVLTYAGAPTGRELKRHLDEIERDVLAKREPFVQIIDQQRGQVPDAMQRALIAEHQGRMDAVYARYCCGEAYVVTAESRAAMTAVFWLAKPPYPYVFVDTMDEAVAWCRTRMQEAQLSR
jgi:hypothetical protein